MTDTTYTTSRAQRLGERLFNFLITRIPSHTVRQVWLRLCGASIGQGSSIMMRSTVLGPHRLVIGDNVSIGSSVLLDARGGLLVEDDVVIASDVHVVTGDHDADSPDFAIRLSPVSIGHHAWIASRATVLRDVAIGVGAVVGAASLVRHDVNDMDIVAGVPARVVGRRSSTLDYHPTFRPLLY
ncbi:acyltransferase [Rhodococcoides kroppenstedtii]|uniref:acyltransferase n=1 Tax=Rhodococcoides kroppenstedtii TaxID=293050 RepID=UPI0028E37A6B|nr:acyltransferase [Rhodococcus kroppenstedtii]